MPQLLFHSLLINHKLPSLLILRPCKLRKIQGHMVILSYNNLIQPYFKRHRVLTEVQDLLITIQLWL